MNLSIRLADRFSAATRKRGQQYYFQRQVRIEQGCEHELHAYVRGSRNYAVNLAWVDPVLSVWCDCPYFESEGPCKHLWAVILAAEAQHYLSAPANAAEVMFDEGLYDDDKTDWDAEEEFPLAPPQAVGGARGAEPAWKKQIAGIAQIDKAFEGAVWPAKKQIVYQVEVQNSIAAGNIILSLGWRERKADGSYTRIAPLNMKRNQIPTLPVPEDREILSAIVGSIEYFGWAHSADFRAIATSNLLGPHLAPIVMPLVIRSGRCFLKRLDQPEQPPPLSWDDGEPWQFELNMAQPRQSSWAVTGFLRRGEERVDLKVPALIARGFVFIGDKVCGLASGTSMPLLTHLRTSGWIEAPREEGHEMLAELLQSPSLPPVEVPEELRYEHVVITPKPALRFAINERARDAKGKVRAELLFDYDGTLVSAGEPGRGVYLPAERRFLQRHAAAEENAAAILGQLGLKFRRWPYGRPAQGWELAAGKLPGMVHKLLDLGWHIEAEGKTFRRPGAFRMEVATGVDWFELSGEVEYGGTVARLPALLEALRRGENMVRLEDGGFGVVPEEWLRKIGLVAGMGAAENGHIRFARNQAGLLDALLASQPEARCDELFAHVRSELRVFQGIEAAPQPAGFVGHLRDYQREGLGWMEFLRRFSFGGCLADDMGVGKTAQVLALLETRRESRLNGEQVGPSLVVAPRSLVFNWREEAARFTPRLRVLDYTGLARNAAEFSGYDLVLTTYGTVRRDALRLKDIEFDYLVLDEAQAVKNSGTEAAKAVRLLKGRHRLAVSGTPVENHLGELFALFEFLNPGMLDTSSVFKLSGGATRHPDEDARALLAQALRPFILRRTKEQVARELPAKTEQTIYCELEPPQRKLYNELRRHYRDSLLARVDKDGLAKSKIQVLEALLRLRQAACHPGLIDVKRSGESSAKLDSLLAQLSEVLAEGHKALVFSQFTSLLKIVRARLDADGVVYEYLDGKTTKRQECVERFQNDATCRLFLISLKAGGLGLNLTAAEYVFLLDPWWNPAVEAQAVDRAHRIGQTQRVFAYRLIARDTVEEKVLELQKTKRDLAASIISGDNSLIRTLKREDLELLLS